MAQDPRLNLIDTDYSELEMRVLAHMTESDMFAVSQARNDMMTFGSGAATVTPTGRIVYQDLFKRVKPASTKRFSTMSQLPQNPETQEALAQLHAKSIAAFREKQFVSWTSQFFVKFRRMSIIERLKDGTSFIAMNAVYVPPKAESIV